MIFKDRQEAGQLLAKKIAKDKDLKKHKNNLMVISLLRGGVVIGAQISRKLNIPHYPLIVAKIPAPYNPELALGGLCFKAVYLNKSTINSLNLSKNQLHQQILEAKKKQASYLKQFNLPSENDYQKLIKNKTVILTDDGIATGATIKAAFKYVKSQQPKTVILAVPVAPIDFIWKGFDKTFIIQKPVDFSAVSQFYQSFSQIKEEEIKNFLTEKD